MIEFLTQVLSVLGSWFKSRARLEPENLVLRQQLNVRSRKAPRRVPLRTGDRLLFVSLYQLFPSIRERIAIIKPETLIRWHRGGFRVY